MLCSFNVNRSHSANLASHFVHRSLGSCVLMSVVMVLGQAEYGVLLIMILSLTYSKANCWLLALLVPALPNLLTLKK